MNVEKNPKTFNYLFALFLRHAQSKIGRNLSIEEINSLRTSISKKCEAIPEKDVVREIYNLRLAELEKKQRSFKFF